MATRNLDKAKEAKKDEFYTQLVDIENEFQCAWAEEVDSNML